MTDNDIKKAFNDALILDSMNIELWHGKEDKPILLPLKEVAELINHLQESKEYYKKSRDKCQDNVMYLSKECDEWQEKCDRLQAENEDLKSENLILSQKRFNIFENLEFSEKTKVKAYKEFAERLKENWQDNDYYWEEADVYKWIDNLLKELVGEDK